MMMAGGLLVFSITLMFLGASTMRDAQRAKAHYAEYLAFMAREMAACARIRAASEARSAAKAANPKDALR